MKITISFLISDLSSSGGTQRMLSLLCNLLIDKYNIIVFVNNGGEPFFKLNDNVKIVVLNGNLVKRNIQAYKVLKKNNVSYYINLDSNSVLFNGLLLPKFTKLIIWEHFSLQTNYKSKLYTLSRKYATKRAYKFILLSNYEAALWKEYYNLKDAKIKIINNPITIDEEKINVRENWSDKKVLAIGNDINIKGFDLLLKAWKYVDPQASLTIVGLPSEQIERLERLKSKLSIKNIVIKGHISNITHYYEKSTFFVLSSRKEAAPLVLLESQAYGLPVIAFNHLPSVREIAEDSVIFVPFEKKEESLANAINKLLTSEKLYLKYHNKSLENAQRFTKDNFVNSWMEIL